MTATFKRLEVWSNYQCAGGTRLAVVDLLEQLIERTSLDGDNQLDVIIPVTSRAFQFIQEQRVFRVVQDDTTFDEWRILLVNFNPDNGDLQCVALPVLADLAKKGMVSSTDGAGVVAYAFDGVGLTPTQHLTQFVLPALASGASWVGSGVIVPTTPVSLSYKNDTPLSALRKLADATGMELQLRRNGTTQYLIDLVSQVGSSAAVADIRLGKNIVGHKQKRDATKQITRIYPIGGEEGGTMGRAVWKVTNIAGTTLTLADPAGGDGPIAFDNQLAGMKLVKVDGSTTNVVVSNAYADTIQVGSAAGIAVGDLVQFRLADGVTDLTYLDTPDIQTVYGVVVGILEASDVPTAFNRVKNPVFRTWDTANNVLPTGWAAVGAPTITKTTAAPYVRRSPNSAKVDATADGVGIEFNAANVFPKADQPYASGYFGLYVVSGAVRVEMVVYSSVTGITTVLPTGTAATNSEKNSWLDLGVSGIDINALQATTVKMRVVQNGATAASFYVDSGQVTDSGAQQTFVEGSGGTVLWQRANRALLAQSVPVRSYEVTLADLARLNPAVYSGDCDLVLGGTVRVSDARLNPYPTERALAITGDGNADGVTDGYIKNIPTANASWVYDTVEPGQKVSINAGGNTGSTTFPGISKDYAANPGELWVQEVDVRIANSANGVTPVSTIQFLSDPSTVIQQFQAVGDGRTSYQRLTSRGVAPAGTVYVRHIIYLNTPTNGASNSAGSIWINNPSLKVLNEGFVLTTRVVELVKNYLAPADTRVTLSNRPDDLVDNFAKRIRTPLSTDVLEQDVVGGGATGPAGPAGPPGPPSANVLSVSTDILNVTVRFNGALSAATGTGPLQYRYRVDLPTGPGAWSNAGAFVAFAPTVDLAVARDFQYTKTVVLEVRDGTTLLSTIATLQVDPLWGRLQDASTESGNMLPNSGYESDGAFWRLSSAASIITDSTKAKTGNKYLQISVAGGVNNSGTTAADADGLQRYIEVQEGQVIQYGGDVYRESGDGNCRWTIGVYDKDKANPAFVPGTNQNTAAWVSVSNEYTVPAGKRYVILYNEIIGATAATVARFDNAKFKILPPASDVLSGTLRSGVLDSQGRNIRDLLSKGAGNFGLADNLDNVPATGNRRAVISGAVDASGYLNLGGSAFVGQLAASYILAANLAAISAALGTITSGLLQNASASPTRAIRLDAGSALPAGLSAYLDLAASGGGYVLRFGPNGTAITFSVDAAGNLVAAGYLKASTLSMLAGSSAQIAGSLLGTGTSVFGEPTASLTAGKRIDLSGGRLRLMADAVSRFELGDVTTSAGATISSPTDTTWSSTTSGNKVNSTPSTWTSAAGTDAGPTNPIETPANLPDQANQYAFDFAVSILVQWALGQTMADAGQTAAVLYTSKDGGTTWKRQGVLATVTHSGARNATTTNNFTGVVFAVPLADLDTVTANNTVFKIVPEVYCPYGDDGAGGPATPTATGVVSVTNGTSKIAWTKATGGTTFARRYPYFRKLASQPHFGMEPLALAELPADNALADGEGGYSASDHAIFLSDGLRKGLIQPEIFKRLTAANSATTSTTGANVANLDLPVQAGEVWEIEWVVDILLSVTTATIGVNVASTGTFTARSSYSGEATAGAPNTGAGILRRFTNNAGTATGTAGGMGNPGSTTLPLTVTVRAYLKIATSGTVSLQLASSSGTITVQEGSRISAWRIA